MSRIAVAAWGMATALGRGAERNWRALLAGERALSAPEHLPGEVRPHGVIAGLPAKGRSLALLELLAADFPVAADLPEDLPLYVSTTVGAIERIEAGDEVESSCEFARMAGRVFRKKSPLLVAAACASGQQAIAAAARCVGSGEAPAALVVGGDVVSRFVTSGFSALGALSAQPCRPYDRDRDGLNLGEAAAGILLCTNEFAAENGLPILGFLTGWGAKSDGAGQTRPDFSGKYLAWACREALLSAGWSPEEVGGVAGHGTGTVFNDLAEIAALRAVFKNPPPVFSLKANIGHTLGATGVAQAIMALVSAGSGMLPPAAGVKTPMDGAGSMLSNRPRRMKSRKVLSLNIGFGGLNGVLAWEGVCAR